MYEKTLGSKINAVKRAYCDYTKRLDTLNYLKPPEKGLPALFFPMQSWCDFLFKCLSWYLYNPYGEKHRCSWDTWKTSFFRHNKRELLLGLPRKHQDAWSLHPMYPTNLKGNGLCNLQIYSASYGEKSGGPTRAVSPCENYQLLHKPIPWRPSFWGAHS